jgi:photosynthetic reaction center H subunit
MEIGAFGSYFDVAQVVTWAFWLFFFGLLFYLRREDRREGYPLQRDPADVRGRPVGSDFVPWIPEPKTFVLPHGGTATSGHPDRREPKLTRTLPFPGGAFEPVGDPMQAGVGPGAYAEREDKPELTLEGQAMIVPLRVAKDFSVDPDDPDPRGMAVIGADGATAGKVSDIWVDRAEPQVRYFEVELPAPPAPRRSRAAAAEEGGEAPPPPAPPAPRVLLPIYFTQLDGNRRRIQTDSILGAQFAGVPRLKNPDQVTKLEEEKITAYYAAGKLYAEPSRVEPLL